MFSVDMPRSRASPPQMTSRDSVARIVGSARSPGTTTPPTSTKCERASAKSSAWTGISPPSDAMSTRVGRRCSRTSRLCAPELVGTCTVNHTSWGNLKRRASPSPPRDESRRRAAKTFAECSAAASTAAFVVAASRARRTVTSRRSTVDARDVIRSNIERRKLRSTEFAADASTAIANVRRAWGLRNSTAGGAPRCAAANREKTPAAPSASRDESRSARTRASSPESDASSATVNTNRRVPATSVPLP